jgi:branched-chain amino acid transport system ATP-binding protein
MTPALEIKNLTKNFGALCAVDNVSLTLMPGERRAILGPNGAGKTTLFNFIAGDYLPTQGQVHLFGSDISSLPPHQRTRAGIARTYQNSLLFKMLTVEENLYLAVRGLQPNRLGMIAPGEKDIHLQDTRHWATQVGLLSCFKTPVGELSHGKQRQLELGMALAARPRLLLLDEPAAGLSQAERPALTKMLLAFPRSLTLLLIEHDMDVALKWAERITVMHNGSVVFDGLRDEAVASKALHELYLGGSYRNSSSSD